MTNNPVLRRGAAGDDQGDAAYRVPLLVMIARRLWPRRSQAADDHAQGNHAQGNHAVCRFRCQPSPPYPGCQGQHPAHRLTRMVGGMFERLAFLPPPLDMSEHKPVGVAWMI